MNPEIRGPRVRLRPLVPGDYEAWREVRDRCRDWLVPWEPNTPPADAAGFAQRCARSGRERAEDRAYGFGIFLDGDFAGEMNLSNVSRGSFQSATVGYWIDEELAGRGLIPEALVVLLGMCFERLRLHRVEVNVIPRNTASRRVVEKLGLRCEGLAERYLCIAGVWEDHVRYAITAEDWDRRGAELRALIARS
jgi:ribosomal-protein-alanine N-acetyltransferase